MLQKQSDFRHVPSLHDQQHLHQQYLIPKITLFIFKMH